MLTEIEKDKMEISVIRGFSGERKVSSGIILFFRGREHWFSEGV
jgi:hypothetical protein